MPAADTARGPWNVPGEAFLLGAVLAVSAAAMLGYGEYDPAALALLIVGLGLLLLGVTRGRRGAAPATAWAVVLVALAALNLYGIGRLPGVTWPLCLAVMVAAAAAVMLPRRRLAWGCLVVAVGVEGAMLITGWVWGSSPIDVLAMLQAGAHQLTLPANPYGVLVPFTAYTGYHGPAAIPFNYGPAAAIIDVPARLAGDVRLMHALLAVLLCGCVAAAVWRCSAEHRLRVTALAALLPLTLPMIHFAWVDLPAMALFALWLVARGDHRWWAALALGLSLAAKPSAVPVLVVMIVWLPRARRDIAAAVGVAALVIAPFAVITGPATFFTDVVSNLADQPPRLDSLTIDGFLHANSLPLLPGVVSVLVVGLVTLAVLVLRRPASLTDVLVSGAIIALTAFLFAKVAYLNYYYTAAVFAVLAVAVAGRPLEETVSAGVFDRVLRHAPAAAYSEIRR